MPTKRTRLDVAQRRFDNGAHWCVVSKLHFQGFAVARFNFQDLMIFARDRTAHAHRIRLLRYSDGTHQK
jgi:hypothetical protein